MRGQRGPGGRRSRAGLRERRRLACPALACRWVGFPAVAPPGGSATAVPSAAVAQRQPGDRIELFHGARVVVPAGWKYDDGNDGGTACLDAVTLEACAVRLIDPEAIRRDGGEIAEPDGESDYGWYLGTDVPPATSSPRSATSGPRQTCRWCPAASSSAASAPWAPRPHSSAGTP